MGFLSNFAAFAFGLYLAWSGQWSTKDLVWSFWLTSLVVGSLTLLSTIVAISVNGWRTKARIIPPEILAHEARLPMIKVSRVSSAIFVAAFVYHVSRSWVVSIAIALIGVCLGLRSPGSRFDKVLSGGLHLVGVLVFPIFLLVFFTLHFGLFHIAHAGFLHFIFPLSELSALNLGAENLNLNSASENLALVKKILLSAFEGLVAPYGLFVLTTLFAEREKIL